MNVYELLIKSNQSYYQVFYSSYIKCVRGIENFIENQKVTLKYYQNNLNKDKFLNKILIENGEIIDLNEDTIIYEVFIYRLFVR